MLTTPAVTIQEPRDFGQRIAAEYWQRTPHVFSSQGSKNPCCGLCLVPDSGQHRERERYAPDPTIATVVSDGVNGYHFTAMLSCGHGPVGFATTPDRAPKVGQPYSCWDCERPVDDRNLPPLPEEIRQRIESFLPKYPACGGPIDKVPFIKRTIQRFEVEVDFRTGELTARSGDADELTEVPDWTTQSPPVIEVECAEGHSWEERRLSYHYDYRAGEHVWRVLPSEPQS